MKDKIETTRDDLLLAARKAVIALDLALNGKLDKANKETIREVYNEVCAVIGKVAGQKEVA